MKITLHQQQKRLDGIRHTGMFLAGIHCLERYSARNFLFADRWILASTIASCIVLLHAILGTIRQNDELTGH